jgi:hypothetical protein
MAANHPNHLGGVRRQMKVYLSDDAINALAIKSVEWGGRLKVDKDDNGNIDLDVETFEAIMTHRRYGESLEQCIIRLCMD